MKLFFIIFLMGCLLHLSNCQEIPQFDVDQVLKRFDRNHDDKLTQNEVFPMVWQRLSNADFNKDGIITRSELQLMKNRLQKMAERKGQLQYQTKETTSSQEITNAFNNSQNWESFDAGKINGLDTKGYFGVVYDGRYIYYVPCRMRDFHGIVLRYDTKGNFQEKSSWKSYDAGVTDGLESKGYAGGVFDGRYVYFVPMAIQNTRHAVVLRYDTQSDFTSPASWNSYDAKKVAGDQAMGFTGAVFHERYIYFVPFGYTPYAHSYIIRYDMQGDFKNENSWSFYNAHTTDGLDTKGFYGGISDGRYIYFVPFNDGKQFHGRVLRYDTKQDFKSSFSWTAHDAGKTEGFTTIGYKGAIFDGKYIYFVPFRDNENHHTRVLRYDTTQNFKQSSSWSTFDASSIDNLDTRGYVGAISDNQYIYFIPYSGENNIFHARFLRFNTKQNFKNSESWSAFDAGSINGLNTKGYKFGAYDGRYLYFAPYHNNQNFSGIALRFDTQAIK